MAIKKHRPLFTPEELEEMRRADAEIDTNFRLTREDIAFSRNADREAKLDRKDNRERKIADQAAYYEANKDKIAERNAAYYEANKDKIAERKAAYYEANKDKIAEYQAAYREANREKYNAYMREYQRKQRAKRKAASRGANTESSKANT